jgi:uncharacterized membrane protein YphA (DoxX/SURF4 family)
MIGITCIGCGGLLVIGFVTPVAGVLVSLCAGAIAFARFQHPSGNLIETNWMNVSAVIVAVAVILLVPGAISTDALSGIDRSRPH